MRLDTAVRIVNYPITKMLLKNNIGYIDKLKKSRLKILLQKSSISDDDQQQQQQQDQQQQQRPYQRFCNLQFWLQSFIFLFWLIRGIVILLISDGSVSATILGSVFNLLKIVRIYPELVAFHFAIKDFLCHLIIYGRYKRFRFYQCIIAYCHQIYNPYLNDEQNNLIKQSYIDTIRLYLDEKKLTEICLFIKERFHGHCHIVCGTTVIIGITGIYSILVFVPYGHIMVLCGLVKSIQNEKQMKNFNRKFSSSKIRSHLLAQSDLFDEIRTMNEFWRSYLSITITVYIILSCLSLYIVALTNVLLSMKIFFIAIFIQPIAIILLLTLTSANLCFKIFQLHKRYYTMLASLHSVRHVNRWKFKLMSSLEIINSKTTGFTLNNQVMIDYKAIGMVIANTTTLFILVAQNLKNNQQ
ncbi:uncharacterized protein LOC124492270 [Dermatophagoides farinae]|uniref:uncharacterized protein LOC124492270 n=1 Tax=Dermatophagoides farinae TaxID=6954 RepID=UPI003F6443B1